MIGGKGDGEVFPRRGRWMPLFVAPTFCVLLGLGVWQLDRLSWKHELLADSQILRSLCPVLTPAPLLLPGITVG